MSFRHTNDSLGCGAIDHSGVVYTPCQERFVIVGPPINRLNEKIPYLSSKRDFHNIIYLYILFAIIKVVLLRYPKFYILLSFIVMVYQINYGITTNKLLQVI